MSLLPSGKTFGSSGQPLFATQQQLQEVVNDLSNINISSTSNSGITVTEPTANNFFIRTNLSNAGGLSFLSYPGSTAIGLSNAGVTQLTAGAGIGVSAGTGSVTVSNTGVNSVSAGTGIAVGGTATAPVITNSIASGVNVVQNQFTTNPISITTPPNGAVTTIVTYGSLVPGKTYLFCLNCGVSGVNVGAPGWSFDKTMSIALTFDGIGEQYLGMVVPLSTTGFAQNAVCAVTVPAGKTSVNVVVGGMNLTGESITGTIYNSVIIPMN